MYIAYRLDVSLGGKRAGTTRLNSVPSKFMNTGTSECNLILK